MVLTADPRAYGVTRDDQLEEIPKDVVVRRAFALDARRHLAVAGRYPRFAALPDRWVSWWPIATAAGWRVARRHRPRVLWSTYPIATAHMIGHSLHRLTRLPWIADFRDSMTEDGYPPEPKKWRVYRRIERKALAAAARSVFTTPGAVRMYRERYPDVDERRFAVIPNGYDEPSFAEAERGRSTEPPRNPIVLLHSGVLYPNERDPSYFYEALARLRSQKRLGPDSVKIVLRNTGHDGYHRQLIAKHGIEELVELAPRIPYREALREMLDADGLLVFQASNCNHQVPAKIYEYLRARRPVLALTDPRGDTAQVLRDASLDGVLPLDDTEAITQGLPKFLDAVRSGDAAVASDEEIAKHSRRARTRALARLFDEVADEAGP